MYSKQKILEKCSKEKLDKMYFEHKMQLVIFIILTVAIRE